MPGTCIVQSRQQRILCRTRVCINHMHIFIHDRWRDRWLQSHRRRRDKNPQACLCSSNSIAKFISDHNRRNLDIFFLRARSSFVTGLTRTSETHGPVVMFVCILTTAPSCWCRCAREHILCMFVYFAF